jgi:osmotically-inducible protein OsmY
MSTRYWPALTQDRKVLSWTECGANGETKAEFMGVSNYVMLINSTPLSGAETDDRIESSFRKSSAYKMDLKDDAIKTESRNGVVTLTGQVNEPSHKYLAQEAVAGLPGVQRVDNRLEVKLEGTEKSDTWIRAKVRSVLALHRHVSGSSTQVDMTVAP